MITMSEKMNVLFIMTDQQRADHLGCAGNPILKTPNIDSIAKEGVRFSNTYCTNPMCMPNRASLITGLYPNMHGLRSNGINLPLHIPTITQSLKNSGWHTVSIGKIHLQFGIGAFRSKYKSLEMGGGWGKNKDYKFPVPYYGYDEVEILLGHGDIMGGDYTKWLYERSPKSLESISRRQGMFFHNIMYETDIPEELYPTSYVTERTLAFLERYSQGDYKNKSNFFLHCSYPDPHHPVCPPGQYYDMYNPDDIELPPSFNDAKNLYNHKFLGRVLKNPPARGAMCRETTEEEARQFIAGTYGSISLIDNGVGKILASLEKLGLADNTIVIYTSDHGDLMGDHGMLLKGPNPFNGVLQVPLIMKVPGMKKSAVADTLVSSIDIPKTIMSLLDIKKRYQLPDMQGVDLTPALQDPNKKVRDCCLIEEDEGGVKRAGLRVRHLVTEDYKLTTYNFLKDYGDLFDRKNDPHELNNLWYDENYKDVRFEILNKLYHENLQAQSWYPPKQAMS
jgi:arylsulfatase A-like enzyme